MVEEQHAKTGYLLGPRFDIIFQALPLLLGLVFAITAGKGPQALMLLVLADVWLFGYHHVIATFTKLAGTKEDRQANHALIYYLPFIILGVVVFTTLIIGIWAIVTVYFFWQWYHYVRQSYGISTFYNKKSGREDKQPTWLVTFYMWSVPLWGLLNRCAQNPDEFLTMPIWLPPVPQLVVTIFGVVAGLSVVWFILGRVKAARNGTLSLPYTFYMASHFVIFAFGYIVMDDVTTGWLAANVWHNLQYILFVWLYNTNRFNQKTPVGTGKVWLAAISQRTPPRIFFYFATTLFISTIVYQLMKQTAYSLTSSDEKTFMVLIVISQAANFHHYIVDSKIWKARNKTHKTVMGVK